MKESEFRNRVCWVVCALSPVFDYDSGAAQPVICEVIHEVFKLVSMHKKLVLQLFKNFSGLQMSSRFCSPCSHMVYCFHFHQSSGNRQTAALLLLFINNVKLHVLKLFHTTVREASGTKDN